MTEIIGWTNRGYAIGSFARELITASEIFVNILLRMDGTDLHDFV